MTLLPRDLVRNVVRLGSGEFLGRLASIGTVIVLGHRYGIVILGVYALAMSATLYLNPIIDFGLRHIGARLLARFPAEGRLIGRRVQRRRILMAAAVVPLLALYATLVNLPHAMKLFLFGFSATGVLYAISLDWAAWGKEHLQFFSLARAVIPFSIFAGVLCAVFLRGNILGWLLIANLAGHVSQVLLFWGWWRHHQPAALVTSSNLGEIDQSLAWRHAGVMGIALIATVAFNSIDMLMLGVLAEPQQVGLYGAAYRIINQVLVTYYLLTVTLYPKFARLPTGERGRVFKRRILLTLFGAGATLAILITLFRNEVLSLLFGPAFLPAAPLLFLLAWCLPLDFLTSYFNSAYTAWGMAKRFLACTLLGAGCELLLNLYGIPRYGAMAAATNTLIAYVVYFAALAWAGRNVVDQARAELNVPC